MITCEPIQTCKIPLKHCQGSIIEHSLVTIQLSVEWPEKGGDEPNLVMLITNKIPTTTPIIQQNQSLSSTYINPIINHNHHHQLSDRYDPPFHPPYFHHPHYSPPMNSQHLSNATPNLSNGDHNDVSSTTTTDLFSPIHPTTLTQSIGNDSSTQLLHQCSFHTTPTAANPLYISQHVVHRAVSTDINNSQLPTQMNVMSQNSINKQIPKVITQVESQMTPIFTGSQTFYANSPSPCIICICSNSSGGHHQRCPARSIPKLVPDLVFQDDSSYNPATEAVHTQQTVFSSSPQSHDAISTLSMVDGLIGSVTQVPFSNINIGKATNPLPNITTAISQQMPITTVKLLASNTDINLQQQIPPSLSQVAIDVPHYQPIPTSPEEQQCLNSIATYEHKSCSIGSSNYIDQEQRSPRTSHDIQELARSLESSTRTIMESNETVDRVISLPGEEQPQQEQHVLIISDNSQNMTKPTCVTVLNNKKKETVEDSARQEIYSQQVRSPVQLDILMTTNLTKTNIGSPEIDQTINEVVSGKGSIFVNQKLKRLNSNNNLERKYSLVSQLVWENNQPSLRNVNLPPSSHQEQQIQSIHHSNHDLNKAPLSHSFDFNNSSTTEHSLNAHSKNKRKPVNEESRKSKSKKLDAPKLANLNSNQDKTASPITDKSQTTNLSCSPQDIPLPRTTSPNISHSNLVSRLISWPNNAGTSSSPICVTTTTTAAATITPNDELTDTTWQLNINSDEQFIDNLVSDLDCEYNSMVFDSDSDGFDIPELLQSRTNENFLPTTPLAPLSASSHDDASNSLVTDKPTIMTGSSNDVYDNFFPVPTKSFCPISQENQVTSSVVTPPDQGNTKLAHHQDSPSTKEYVESNVRIKTSTSKLMETTPNAAREVNKNTSNQNIQSCKKQHASNKKTIKKTNQDIKPKSDIKSKSRKISPSNVNPKRQPNQAQKPKSTMRKCTRCGLSKLTDITKHEFPKQKGLVFECTSCGNNSMKSNVSNDERKRRLAKVAADHSSKVECQFCRKPFHSHNDYLMHLKNDHASNKPM